MKPEQKQKFFKKLFQIFIMKHNQYLMKNEFKRVFSEISTKYLFYKC